MSISAFLIASNALITSFKMSCIGSGTITPFLTKATWLSYVYPCTATAAHDL